MRRKLDFDTKIVDFGRQLAKMQQMRHNFLDSLIVVRAERSQARLSSARLGGQDKTRQDKTGTARLERLPNRDLRGEVLLLGAWKTMARRAADRKRLSYSNLYIMCTTDNLVALDQISLTLQRALTSTCRKMPVMWKT